MTKTPDDYLKESKQIKITELVKEHAQKAKEIDINQGKDLDENLQIALKVTKYILTKLHKIKGYNPKPNSQEEIDTQRKLKDSVFRKRDLNQVLKEGYYPTCSDIGLVFRGLMVALGVPTAYVETFHEDYLFGRSFHGHVVGKVYANERWYYVDPQNNSKRISESEEELFPLIVFKEGLDSWDIGIHGYDDMHKLKLENIKELMEKYKRIAVKLADKIIANPELTDFYNSKLK